MRGPSQHLEVHELVETLQLCSQPLHTTSRVTESPGSGTGESGGVSGSPMWGVFLFQRQELEPRQTRRLVSLSAQQTQGRNGLRTWVSTPLCSEKSYYAELLLLPVGQGVRRISIPDGQTVLSRTGKTICDWGRGMK